MKKEFEVTVSKEAGVYVANVIVKAEDEEEAEEKVMNMAGKGNVDWEYEEGGFGYVPLIQVEEVIEV